MLANMVVTISLHNKEHIVLIQPFIRNVYFNKIESYEDARKKFEEEDDILGEYIPISEKMAIEFEVLFEIEKCIWKIPYIIIIEKLYIKENLKLELIYRKNRARLQKFDDIIVSNEMLYPFLLHTLFLLDRSKCNYCIPDEFETIISENTFYFNNDLKFTTNRDTLYQVSQSFSRTRENYYTYTVPLPEEHVSFNGIGRMNYNSRLVEGIFCLNVFPTGFIDSYIERFIYENGHIIEPYHKYSDQDKTIEGNLARFNTKDAFTHGDKRFHGSYEECFKFLEDKNNIATIKKAPSLKKTKESDDSCDYYNSSDLGNPWTDVFGEGDEASTAYWNTD